MKLLSWIKNRYSLRLQDINDRNGKIFCIFSESGLVNKFELDLDQVLSSVDILRNISPDVVLALKEISMRRREAEKQVRITCVLRGGNYQLAHSDGLRFVLSGDMLCRDLQLLDALSIQDAFKIIYETAHKQGFSDCKAAYAQSRLVVNRAVVRLVKKV